MSTNRLRLAYTVAAVCFSFAFAASLISLILELTAPNPHYTGRGMLGAGGRSLFLGAMGLGAWAKRSQAPKG
jgi:hypothetical protein